MRGRFSVVAAVSAVAMCSLWASSSAAEPVDPQPPAERTVLVGFQASGHARLQSDTHLDGRTTDWFTVCEAPCTRRVPAYARFRAVGLDAAPSESFRLPNQEEGVLVNMTLEKPRRTTPQLVMMIGYATALVGIPVAFFGLLRGMTGQDEKGVMFITGAVLTVGGLVAGTAGLIAHLSSSPQSQSVVSIAQTTGPRLALPGGFALESRGLTF